MLLERGTLLNNRYRIVEILGQGGMGSVYRSVDENLGMEVAVKDNLFTTDEYARQFRREAVILANLRHPNLPRVTDHFVITGQGQYLVMDYIEGEDLRQRLERVGVLPEEELIIVGAAVCDALSYLSSRNPPIIHRDIKPGNVKITPQGQIFLVDFGLAKALVGSQATTTGARAMTPGYSPPEQYGTARTDQRSDIYSLAATLYVALTGATPEDALARAMDQADLTPVRKHNPQVSKQLAATIEKGLAVRPDDRYQDAEEFKKELLASSSISKRKNGEYYVAPPPADDNSLSSENRLLPVEMDRDHPDAGGGSIPPARPGSIIGESLSDSKPKAPRKRSGLRSCVTVLIFLLILGGGIGAWSYFYNPDLTNRVIGTLQPYFSEAISYLVSPTHTPENKITNTPVPTLTMELVSSPSATLTETPHPTSTPQPTITPAPTDTMTPTAIPTPLGGGGGQIAFVSNETGTNQIYVINVDGTGRRQITDFPEGACQPDWSPDATRLVFISPCESNVDYHQGSAMFVINLDGSGLTPLPTMIGGDYFPKWSPDGTKIAFTSLRNSNRPQVYVLNLEDNTVEALSEKYSFDTQPSWSPDGEEIIFITERRGFHQIWVMNADGSDQKQFSHGLQAYRYSRPSWSPDMKTVLFTQLVTEGAVPRVGVAPFSFDDDYVEYFIGQESLPMREAVYSPDGLWLAYEGWEAGGSHNIYVIAVTGAGRAPITNDSSLEFDPVWRPIPK